MSEDIDKLNSSIRELNDVVRTLSGQMGDFADATVANTRNMAASTPEQRKAAESLQRLRQNTDGLSEAEKARLEAQKKLAAYDAQLAEASGRAKDAIKGFASGVLDTNVKLTNLNAGLSSAGDAAFALGKAFGPLGMLIGGVVKGFTMLIEANLKISQAYLEGKDQLSKMGGAGTHTTQSLQKMTREADLNAETIGRMIKPMQGMGQSIMALGGNAGDAQKSFAKLIKATDEERAMMSRLGINQEQMMQGTADYLALQSASGRGVKSELQDREKLRKASLDYQTQLVDLAALTGKDVDALKAEQKEMLMNRQVQLKNIADNAKEDRLRREAEKETDVGRKKQLLEQADAIAKESKARNEAFSALAGGPKILQKGIQELTTGTIAGENAQKLARLGMQKEIDEFNKTIREGGNQQEAARKLQDAYIQKFGERAESTSRQMAISGEVAKMYGADSEQELELIANRRGKSYELEGKEQEARRKALQEAGKDPEADARAALQNANIKATGAVEDLVTTLNPLKLGFVGLAAAAGAAALALGVMAKKGMFSGPEGATGIGSKVAGAFGFGKKDAGIPGMPTVPAGGGAAGGAGAVAESLGKGPAGGGKGFLEKAADGLAAFANPKVVIGAGAFGVAIAAVGAGIAGATWIISKALPSLAEGLAPFEKLDGDKLKSTGIGMTALAGGMAAFGAGTAIAGIGNIVGSTFDKLGEKLGIDGPFKKLEDFSKLNINAGKVKENAEAFSAFGKAMAAGQAGAAAGSGSGLVGGLMDKLSGKLDLKGPVQQLQEFGAVKVNVDNVKNNADAMVMFGDAMAKYKGTNETMWGTLTAGVAGFFKQEPPYAKMQNFAKIDLGEDGAKRVKTNAQAFVYFSQALSEFKGTSELKNAADSIVGGIVKMFGGDDVMGKFVKFTKLDVDPDKALKLGQAFAAYSSSIATLSSGGGASGGASGGAKAASPGAKGGGSAPTATASRGGSSGGTSGGSSASSAPMSGGDRSSGAGKDSSGGSNIKVATATGKGGSMSDKDVKDMIKRHEGVRTRPYKDSLGLWTVGVGHLIGDGRSLPPAWDREFSMEEVDALFEQDFEHHKKQAQSNVPGFSKFDSMGQGALIDLTFNMGPGWPKKFPNTSKKLAAGDTEGAAEGLTDSLWYQQVKSRGPTIVEMVRNSKVSARDGGLAMGPDTGYPATLHGNEMIVPLDPNSILADLGKKSSAEIESKMAEKSGDSMSTESFKELTSINQAMLDMMSNKLDAVINKLETSNDTQGKLLKYSQA